MNWTALLLLVPITAFAGEKTVNAAAVPPIVVKNATARYPTGKVVRYVEEIEGKKKSYEVQFDVAGQRVELMLTADGVLEAEERVVAAKDLPVEVSRTLAAGKHAGAKIGRVERVEDLRTMSVVWEVVVEEGGKRRELVFDSSGALKKDKPAGIED